MSERTLQLIDPLGGGRVVTNEVTGIRHTVEFNGTVELPETQAMNLIKQDEIWKDVTPSKTPAKPKEGEQ